MTGLFKLRDEPGFVIRLGMSFLFLALVGGLWIWATAGATPEQRIVPRSILGSPAEVFGAFGSLWFDRALMRNLLMSLWRVAEGFGLALLVGIPLGILCGTFRWLDAFFAPFSIFGRNVPIAALVPLTLVIFGIDEGQKIAFIFISCVAFVMYDTARAISSVSGDYLDTAYTLGASRRQVIAKVLIPLALPEIFNSIRLLFGLAFGYIILAEMVNAEYGVGRLILTSQRRGMSDDVMLILLFVALVAFLIDRLLFTLQRSLFSYRYAKD